ncbi:MAG: dihydropteroate synthase-like protein [Methanocellales archaeon]|nr:dihydropteroate synthase-like protein [Methanocellales archaeon]
MRILVTTGRRAYDSVKKAVGNKADVLLLDVDVAALITPSLLRAVSNISSYDLVLVPGLASGDFASLERGLGVKIRLGPKHACDLDWVLQHSDEIEFSHTVPACQLLSSKKRGEALERICQLEGRATPQFTIKDVKIGGNSRMKVTGEIVDATRLHESELQRVAERYLQDGADIIDLGIPLDATPAEVRRTVEATSSLGVPISIDTLDSNLILAGVEAGADMVLSLNSSSIKSVGWAVASQDIAAVVIPDDDFESLWKNIEMAQEIGIKKIVADPILAPIGHGFIDSLTSYHKFRQVSNLPLFFGVGNITELMDADSIGINATLAGIAMELYASILFTPQYSDKAKGSIKELKTATQMMLLAKDRGTAPKDLGLDLLIIKEKRRREDEIKVENPIEATPHTERARDPKGCFRIAIHDEKIVAKHEKEGITITGTNAKAIFDTIQDLGLVSLTEHAAYLGRELMKAELALRFGRSYIQDDEF